MKTGDFAKADPVLTGIDNWVEGKVISVKNNPFLGTVIAIQDDMKHIFFGEEKYFKQIEREACLQ